MFLLGAETGVKPEPRRGKHKKKGWRSITSTQSSEKRPELLNPDSPLVEHRSSLPRWFLPVAILGVVSVGTITWWLIRRERSEGGAPPAEPDLVLQTSLLDVPPPIPAPPKNTNTDPDPVWARHVQDVAEKFLKADNISALIPLIRNPQDYEAAVKAAYSGPDKLPIGPDGAIDLLYTPPAEGGDQLAMLFFRNRQDRLQGLVIVDTESGLLVDWPSLSGHGDMTVEEFLKQRPTVPTLLRVAAKQEDYYNFEYIARDEFVCLRLTEFPEEHVFYGYLPVSNLAAERLRKLPKHDPESIDPLVPKPQPLAIKAAFRADSKSPNQVEILEVLGNGWYVP